jgi:hypothetical protein
VHGRAAVLYERAVHSFGDELGKVDASIASIRNGEFLTALAREEIRQDKDWVIHMRRLPDVPETFYLMTLMASHDFQTALQNYLDLEDLRKKLTSWHTSFTAFEDMIRIRRSYYKPLLPKVDDQFRRLDARMRLRVEQRDHMNDRLQRMLVAPRPEHLATGEERMLAEQLGRLRARLDATSGPGTEEARRRLDRLAGVLTWSLQKEYHQRLTEAHDHLRELNRDVEILTRSYDAFVRTRQAATHSHAGYDESIDGLQSRVTRALERVDILMARQGHVLERVAIAELEGRRERLEAYQNQARFAFADSYDRAAKAQARAE